jgi:MoaA/NifB/PqqE/SkfB family radical SAM enzyme
MFNLLKKPAAPLPQYLNLLPSYLCNARCQICNIWQKNPETQLRKSEELTIPEYRTLFHDPWLKDLRHVSISGGEPFLYPQLVDLIQLIPKSAVITIATNATVPMTAINPWLPELAKRDNFYLQISLDGSESTHNLLRGIPTAYQTALELIAAVQRFSIPFYFSMVITTLNYSELEQVYLIAKQYNTFVQFNPIHPGDYYSNPELRSLSDWTEPKITTVADQLHRIIPDLIARNKIASEEIEFYKRIPDYLRSGKIVVPDCFAGRIAVYLDPYGSIFPCPVYWKEMGNVKTGNPIDVWNSHQAEQVRHEIANLECWSCWHICQMPLNLRLNKSQISC